MKAIVVREFGAPDVLKLEETADLKPNENQILVKIEAAGVNPVDTYVRQGNHATAPPLPFTPGKDGAGIVESVGANVSKVKTSERVYLANSVSGTYAEFALAEENQVYKLPDNAFVRTGARVFPCRMRLRFGRCSTRANPRKARRFWFTARRAASASRRFSTRSTSV